MKTLIFLIVLFLSTPVLAGDLRSGSMDTGLFPCDLTSKDVYWFNEGPAIKVKQVTVWLGLRINGKADMAVCVYRLTDGTILSCVGWDRYSNPTGLHQWTQNFAPDYINLETEDGLGLQASCSGLNSITKQGHVVVKFWYTQD